jgi:hypothetical protein
MRGLYAGEPRDIGVIPHGSATTEDTDELGGHGVSC